MDSLRIGLKESLNSNDKASGGGSKSDSEQDREGPTRKGNREKAKFKHVSPGRKGPGVSCREEIKGCLKHQQQHNTVPLI